MQSLSSLSAFPNNPGILWKNWCNFVTMSMYCTRFYIFPSNMVVLYRILLHVALDGITYDGQETVPNDPGQPILHIAHLSEEGSLATLESVIKALFNRGGSTNQIERQSCGSFEARRISEKRQNFCHIVALMMKQGY